MERLSRPCACAQNLRYKAHHSKVYHCLAIQRLHPPPPHGRSPNHKPHQSQLLCPDCGPNHCGPAVAGPTTASAGKSLPAHGMRNKKVTLLWASDHRNPHEKASRILCRLCRKAQPAKRPKTVYSPLPEPFVNFVETTLNIALHIGNEQYHRCCRRNAIQTNAKRNHSFPLQTAVNGTPFSPLRH